MRLEPEVVVTYLGVVSIPNVGVMLPLWLLRGSVFVYSIASCSYKCF